MPFAGMIQDHRRQSQGTASSGGGHDEGTIYAFTPGIPPTPVQFVPLTPCRVVDTRNPDGPFGGPSIQGGTARSFALPQGACGIPDSAAVYSLNVTVVPHSRLGYLTIWPTGQPQPGVSTMNSDGRTKANAAIVPAGTGGAVSVYVSDTTDVLLDINGYFTSTTPVSTYEFYPLPPCRLVDTRGPNGGLGGPFLQGAVERDFSLLDSPCLRGLPQQPQAAAQLHRNTQSAGAAPGFLMVWPAGGAKPSVSTLNNGTATNVANAAIVPAPPDGRIAVYPSQSTDLLVDINGYFATADTGGMQSVSDNPLPRDRYSQWRRSAVQWRTYGERGGQRLRAFGQRSGICAECYGDSERTSRLPDAMARPAGTAQRVDAECYRRSGDVKHGNCADRERLD